ncbi:molecular chaperone DnaJ [Geomonas limicola]|uniref:Molecular chaperone DnaJ n=1 Tax=Geomonas limicola TaxID=2740186 RepID=A0A6V8NEU0_9BACT|nr:J domain-containing protein [Geomonas limicola]GFO70324.1 molecular chaperone DnaJ [Geomonas limicola]
MTFKELCLARAVFGLGERATLKEVKDRHRELVKRHHPDAGNGGDPAQIRKVNAAYRVLTDYLTEYRFSFSEDEFYEQNPEERLRRQFMDESLWTGR